jgi:perosamine synthetase
VVSDAGRRIPLSEPAIGPHEQRYIAECLASGWVSTAGPWVPRFEQAVAARVGAREAVATNNGTAALHTALLVAGVGPGDAVVVPDLTFIAPVNAIRYCGAEPVFVDVDADRWQIDPASVRAYLETGTERRTGGPVDRASGRRIAGILAVHLLGLPAPIDPLLALAAEWRVPLVQDAAQAMGVETAGRRVGSFGGLVAFSFNGNKTITAGAGGMVVTDDPEQALRARYLTTQAKDDPVYFRHDTVGFNYRLSSLHAALGLAQLERIDALVEARRAIRRRYREALAGQADVRWVEEAPGDRATYWLTSLAIDGDRARRDRVLRALIDAGIDARPPWQVNSTQRPYAAASRVDVTRAARIADIGLHLPSSAGLSVDDQARVIETLTAALRT